MKKKITTTFPATSSVTYASHQQLLPNAIISFPDSNNDGFVS
jgi:hypothetical protein